MSFLILIIIEPIYSRMVFITLWASTSSPTFAVVTLCPATSHKAFSTVGAYLTVLLAERSLRQYEGMVDEKGGWLKGLGERRRRVTGGQPQLRARDKMDRKTCPSVCFIVNFSQKNYWFPHNWIFLHKEMTKVTILNVRVYSLTWVSACCHFVFYLAQ